MRENILALDVTEQIHKTREVTAAFFFLVDAFLVSRLVLRYTTHCKLVVRPRGCGRGTHTHRTRFSLRLNQTRRNNAANP